LNALGFPQVLDTTIALVALRYIAGGLSAASDGHEQEPSGDQPSGVRLSFDPGL
jgi:hypothetical protein